MKLTDALIHYLAQDNAEAQKDAALSVGAAAREQGVPAWCWYDPAHEEPLMLVVDLPLGTILLPLAVLHSRPEGVVADWPEQIALIARQLATRNLS